MIAIDNVLIPEESANPAADLAIADPAGRSRSPSRSLAGQRRDGLVFGRLRGSVRAVPPTYAVVLGRTQGRIGQANETTSPPRPAACGSRSTVPLLRRAVSAVGSRSTADVRGFAGRWTGLWSGGESPLVPHTSTKRGTQSFHQRTSIHVQAYVVRILAA